MCRIYQQGSHFDHDEHKEVTKKEKRKRKKEKKELVCVIEGSGQQVALHSLTLLCGRHQAVHLVGL